MITHTMASHSQQIALYVLIFHHCFVVLWRPHFQGSVACLLPNMIVCPRIKRKKSPEGPPVKENPTGQNVTTAPPHWDSHYMFS